MARSRAVVIGCGGMGRAHLKALALVDQVEVVGFADGREAARDETRKVAPDAQAFDSAEPLLAELQPELVVIATNGPSHAELTIAAAEGGAKYILCEKPIATSLRDAQTMLDCCDERGVRLGINHTRRWSPAVRKFRDLLAEGAIGRVRSLLYTLGAGRLGCNGCHVVDLIRMLTGQEVVDVIGYLDTTGTPNPRGPEFRDPGAHALLHLSDGARVFLDEMEDLGVPPSLSLVGSVGRARVEDVQGQWEVRARAEADREKSMLAYGCPLHPVPFDVSECPTLAQWDHVQADAIRNLLSDEPIACSGLDGYKSIEAIFAVHLSDQRGHAPVKLPLTGDDLDLRIDFT